ncbi:hypothetical protein BH20ACT19_BH20ACT19_05870 [soil metagenome]
MGGLPPGPSASPLRQAAEWVRRPLPLLEECGRRYGETFTLRLAGLPPMVMITRPGTVREVFTGDPEVLRSGEANALLSAGLGKRSLLVLDGADHLRERRLMLPPFHGERMRQYGDLIRAIAEREIATWPAGAELALAPRMRTIALEVIVRAVFGVEGRERVERLQRALGRLLDSSSRPHRVLALLLIAPDGWTVRTWRRHAPTIRRVDALLLEEIRLRRADPCAAERPDILSLLLAARYEDGAPMGDAHLRDELMTLLVAGARQPPSRSRGRSSGSPGTPPPRSGSRPRSQRERTSTSTRSSRRRCGYAPSYRSWYATWQRRSSSKGPSCRPGSGWPPAPTSCTGDPTSTPGPRPSGPSASLNGLPARTRGYRSAAGHGAASAPRLPPTR